MIEWLDIQGAYFFNSFLGDHLFWHHFWNFMRSSKMDWVYDLVILLFAVSYIAKKEHLKRVVKCLFLLIFTVGCFLPVHRGPVAEWIRPVRICPLGVLNIQPLSREVTGESRKGYTDHSYPSDHGYTVFMFIFAVFFLQGWPTALLALLISFPMLVARFVTGTHWVSDVLCGSIPIAFFNMSLLFLTPLRKPFAKGCDYIAELR